MTTALLLRCLSRKSRPIIALRSLHQEHQAAMKYQLVSAVLLERVPRLSKTLSPLQKQYFEMIQAVEIERSLKSDHEVRDEREIVAAEAKKRGENVVVDYSNLTTIGSSLKTAKDQEDEWRNELSQFQPANRETLADQEQDIRSPDRALERPLRLLVHRRPVPDEAPGNTHAIHLFLE